MFHRSKRTQCIIQSNKVGQFHLGGRKMPVCGQVCRSSCPHLEVEFSESAPPSIPNQAQHINNKNKNHFVFLTTKEKPQRCKLYDVSHTIFRFFSRSSTGSTLSTRSETVVIPSPARFSTKKNFNLLRRGVMAI